MQSLPEGATQTYSVKLVDLQHRGVDADVTSEVGGLAAVGGANAGVPAHPGGFCSSTHFYMCFLAYVEVVFEVSV